MNEEEKIREDRAREDWLRRAPEQRDPYNSPLPESEDEHAHRIHEVEKWLREMPAQRNPYDDGRG